MRISLLKQIPVGAGLGGGSSNCAVALLALNQLWKCNLKDQELMQLGAGLGSDVAFFFRGGTALGSGRGEQLLELPDDLPRTSLILLYPKFEIATKMAYGLGNWGLWEGEPVLTKQHLDNTIQRFQNAVKQGWLSSDYLENDFEDVLLRRYTRLAEAGESLTDAGCERVMLCGSGSTLLGMAQPEQIEAIARAISERQIGEVFLCHTLSRNEYEALGIFHL